jgi:competence protein ComEA
MDVSGAPSSSISAGEPVRDSTPQPARAVAPKINATASKNEAANGKSPAQPPAAEIRSGQQSPERAGFWLRRSDQFVFAVVAIVLLALLVMSWIRLTRWGTVPVEIDRLKERQFDYRLDINSATWVEWTQLDGIGDSLARRIVADRESNGPFSSIDELRRVKGIGPKTLEKIRPWLTMGPENSNKNSPDSSDLTVPTGR